MKRTPTFLLFLLQFMFVSSFAQTVDKALLCKKWALVKYQEADGTTFAAPPSVATDYLQYNADGTMISLEDGEVVKGNWVLDEATATLTNTQTTNKNYPAKIVSKVLKLTEHEFVVQSKDAGGEVVTLYMKPFK